MKIVKEALGGQRAALAPGDLERIGQLARRPLEEDEIYTFSVRLCDNEVDRELERFPPETLEQLAGLFVGKSGLFDHQWSAKGQAARIYKTEVVYEPSVVTQAGDGYCWLKGYAYMLRTPGNQELICQIEGGIKKEVSVGCAVERAVCSICGADRDQGGCGHVKGQEYGGQLCWTSLEGASDAYEFSFVAVPAQPRAGVVKSAAAPERLRTVVKGDPALTRELEQLEREAQLGRGWRKELQERVVRLALLSDSTLEDREVQAMVQKLSVQELEMVARAFGRRAEERYPLQTQLDYGERTKARDEADQAFLV